jgi:ribosomal subunit interface protein
VKLIVRTHNVPISNALLEHSEARIERAARPFRDRLARIEVVFGDLNGPKKALGQTCRIFIELASGRTLTHESRARDHYTAMTAASYHASRQLARMIARERHRLHTRELPRIVA